MIVAKAYIDQLERSPSLSAEQIKSLRQAVQNAESSKPNKKVLEKLKSLVPSLEKSVGTTRNESDSARLKALVKILKQPVLR